MRILIEGQLMLGGELHQGWIEVHEGRIRAIDRGRPPRHPDKSAFIVTRGLCDLQVNGAGGWNVTDGMNAIRAIDELELAHGVTSYLPTIISTSAEEATEAIATITSRMTEHGSPIAGIHLEGPFLDPEHRGVHRLECLRSPAGGVPDYYRSSAVRMVTIAPELPGALELIAELAARQVLVSIGHTGANEDEAERAVMAGASAVTHLFNAMRKFDHRHPNVPGWALTRGGVTLAVIPDGFHTHPLILRLIDRVAGERVVLVTDSTPAAGAPEGVPYEQAGIAIENRNGRVVTSDDRLAGSALTLDGAVRDWVTHTGGSAPKALEAASERPARLMGLADRLRQGALADITLLDEHLSVVAVMFRGEWVVGREDR
jgi:N-acetylglucosamine-6-phosphate deacetylase